MSETRIAGAHEARCPKGYHPQDECNCEALDRMEDWRKLRLEVMRPTARLAFGINLNKPRYEEPRLRAYLRTGEGSNFALQSATIHGPGGGALPAHLTKSVHVAP